jgi:hypothetical protein
MKTRLFALISGLTLAGAVTITPVLVSAEDLQDPQNEQLQAESRQRSAQARKVEGVWDVTVAIRECQTGVVIRTVRGRNMFIRGGMLTELAAQSSPSLRSPSFGTWRYVGERHYTAVFRFSRFNPDGTFAATQKVSRGITLNRHANVFTANAIVELFDANDNPILPNGCATETAVRLE